MYEQQLRWKSVLEGTLRVFRAIIFFPFLTCFFSIVILSSRAVPLLINVHKIRYASAVDSSAAKEEEKKGKEEEKEKSRSSKDNYIATSTYLL